jgi:hypothetical protein
VWQPRLPTWMPTSVSGRQRVLKQWAEKGLTRHVSQA